MKNRGVPNIDDDRRPDGLEIFTRDFDGILACRHGIDQKFTVSVRFRCALPVQIAGRQLDIRALDGTVLWVMHNATHGAENIGVRRCWWN